MGSHVHDPVDQQKLRDWFGREPNYEYLCKEVVRRFAPADPGLRAPRREMA